jgi:hypothetical protein
MMTSMLTKEELELVKANKAESLFRRKDRTEYCKSETEHLFESTGECTKCGAHRSPYRVE